MNNQAIAPDLSLAGKSALVTGASRGIGFAIAECLAALGARVLLVARDPDHLEHQLLALRKQGFSVSGISADLSQASDRQKILAALDDSTLNILINNVGTNIRRASADYSLEEFRMIMQTNLESAYDMCMLARPLLAAHADSSIVNVSSVAGLTHLSTGTPYGMSKAAMIQLTRNLAVEWAADGIRVNAVAPWYIDTPLARRVLDDPDFLAAVIDRTPMGRIGEAREVAAAVAFFCSAGASYITGQCLAIDGGFTALGFDAQVR